MVQSGGANLYTYIWSTAAKTANVDPIMTYGASKAALESFTRSLANTFAADKCATFNSVSVGPTATETFIAAQSSGSFGFLDEQTKEFSAAKRLGDPDDIAYIVGFLAGEEGRWVNGASVSANGGYRSLLAALG